MITASRQQVERAFLAESADREQTKINRLARSFFHFYTCDVLVDSLQPLYDTVWEPHTIFVI